MIPAFATVSATIKQGKNRDILITIENNLGLSWLQPAVLARYRQLPAVPLYSDFSVAVKVYGPVSGPSQEVFSPSNRSPLVVQRDLDARFRRLYTVQLGCKATCRQNPRCLLSIG